jgi:hypothetical protein
VALNLTDADLPPLYRAADQSSMEAQRAFLTATGVRLAGLLGAAFFGLFVWHWGPSPVDWAGVSAALCFAAALLVEGYLLKSKPERTWYQGRAAAESVKTLSWRYAMDAEPFSRERTSAEADELFLRQLNDVLDILRDSDLAPDAANGEQITDAMRALRAVPLAQRKTVYEEYRVS